MDELIGTKVKIYRNLHNGLWSILSKLPQGWRVVGYAPYVLLEGPFDFLISESGRKRVIKEKRKNVHAYVTGYIVGFKRKRSIKGVEISYDPYFAPYFFTTHNKKRIDPDSIDRLYLNVDTGRLYGEIF